MAFGVMSYVLAVTISATTPRPCTMNTSTEAARRDEYSYRTTTHSDDGPDCESRNIVPAAATRQHNNNNYCTAPALHTACTQPLS